METNDKSESEIKQQPKKKKKSIWLISILCLFAIAFIFIKLTKSDESDVCSHQWGEWLVTKEATCRETGVQERRCEKCGVTENDSIITAEHIPNADDGDCTTAIICSVCGDIVAEGNTAHIGGAATCESKAECDVCGKEYGETASHIPNEDDGDCTTAVTCSVCGDVTTSARANHTGGIATCKNKAECSTCGKEYGNLGVHIPNTDDGDCTTAVTCSACGDVTTPARKNHIGGTVTCKNKAECAVCGKEYGGLLAHTPGPDDGDCTTAVICTVCGKVITPVSGYHIPSADDGDCTTAVICMVCGKVIAPANGSHTPNADDGDCTTAVICTVCGRVTTPANGSHTPNADDGDCTTAVICSVCGRVTTPANGSHTPNADDGDCTTAVICTVCGKVIAPANGSHTPNADDGDCTTAVICSVCGSVTTEANASHTGGTATCENKAECEICGKEYGEMAEHTGDTAWIKHTDTHYLVYSCCYTQATAAEEHTIEDGACTVCGYNPTITSDSVEAVPGETQVVIVVSITDNPGIIGMTATIEYSSDVITLTDVRSGDALSGLTFTAPDTLSSGCTVMWDAAQISDEDIKDGEVLILTFDVAADAPQGEYSILLSINTFDNDLNRVNLSVEGGKVTINNN